MQKAIFSREGLPMDNVLTPASSIMMEIIMKGKCTRINSMVWELLPTVKLLKKDCFDTVNLSLDLSLSMTELFIKGPCKMDKNLAKALFKEKTAFTILDTSNMTNLTETVR